MKKKVKKTGKILMSFILSIAMTLSCFVSVFEARTQKECNICLK
ncbi:MAG: hypothetical protein AB6733_14805 [Clostridiaceae bacterium]